MRDRLVFAAGGLAAVLAVSPPVDALAHENLVWHMAQHLVLLVVAAPLLVLGGMRAWRAATRPVPLPLVVTLVAAHVVVVAAWHLPPLFDATERSLPLHAAEHLSFLAAATGLWWAAGLGTRPATPVASLAVFVASLPGIALGAAMTMATQPWYQQYPSLIDQQVAGALMWSVGGAATVLCGVLSLVRSLSVWEAAG
ncbi:MAG: cytochrome c oxidase assembly protein [Actinomycetia bacterium]|nr:cytochrome c oxidase assembly protein [Actinomycetes bacterium]